MKQNLKPPTKSRRPGEPTFDNMPEGGQFVAKTAAEDKVLTIRVSEELYDAVAAEAKSAKHSINSGATILIEEALLARGRWHHPEHDEHKPFWLRGKK